MSLTAKDLFNIDGRVALVTGGSSGVGKMIASVFAANGARTYVTGRNADRLAMAAAELAGLGDCRPLQADLSNMIGIEQLVEALAAQESRLDILVNNAGTTWAAPFESFPEAGWDKLFDVNVKSPFFLIQKLLPLLRAAATEDHWARVINISSTGARSTATATLVYHASKAAVEQMTRVMAKALGPDRVTVNAIAPGWFPSRINEKNPQDVGDRWKALAPLGRFGTPEDIGGLAMFLCSRAGAFVDGQVIDLDGGRMGG
jgi:NAD(P)-dependent dehydrogenase (short-subunit alcohol dehydrogenase family)